MLAHVRQWALARDTAYVITGSMFWDSTEDHPSTARGTVRIKRIGSDGVAIPTHFYKIVVSRVTDGCGCEAIAFVMPNRPASRHVDFTQYLEPVARIKRAQQSRSFRSYHPVNGFRWRT